MSNCAYAFALKMLLNVSNASANRQNVQQCHQHKALQIHFMGFKTILIAFTKVLPEFTIPNGTLVNSYKELCHYGCFPLVRLLYRACPVCTPTIKNRYYI